MGFEPHAWGPNLGIWIFFGYNFNFVIILRFGDSKISIPCILQALVLLEICAICQVIHIHPNLNITAKSKLYPKKIYIPKLNPGQLAGGQLAGGQLAGGQPAGGQLAGDFFEG